jgi:coproporphyrinogen III oxidase
MEFKEQWVSFIEGLQDAICAALEEREPSVRFREDKWERPGGGGGRTRVIVNGKTFEKGGVNISAVSGEVTDTMRRQLQMEGHTWFAAGLSLVIHPVNPFVPTVHCNYRMFEMYDESGALIDRWFGGGTDLTPYYLFEEDARHFHGIYKKICDQSDPSFYAVFKKECDQYFVNTHRNNERRGIGGIFYDHQRKNEVQDEFFWLRFANGCGYGFVDAYLPIVDKRMDMHYTPENRYWQEIRRGRYTEFNLVHDRGTVFGLKTNGRTESILMSLPPVVRFDYDHHPEPGSEEDKLWKVCLTPVDWV